LLATLLRSASIDGFCRMMAITTVVGGGLAVANNPVSGAQGGFRFRGCGRRRRWWGRGGRGRIVCAAKKGETRHAGEDSFPSGRSDSIEWVSRFSKPPREGPGDGDDSAETRFIRSHFGRKIALGFPLAGPSRRFPIHLHFSLTVFSISLILPASYRFSRHQNQPMKEEGSGSLPRCAWPSRESLLPRSSTGASDQGEKLGPPSSSIIIALCRAAHPDRSALPPRVAFGRRRSVSGEE